MERHWHTLGKPRTRKPPDRILYLDTETTGVKRTQTLTECRFRLGTTCLAKRNPKTLEWSHEWSDHTDRDAMAEYVMAVSRTGSSLTVIVSNPVFDAWVLGMFHEYADDGWTLSRPYVSNLTCILQWTLGRRRVTWLAIQNFIPSSVDAMSPLVSLPKITIDFATCSLADLQAHCRRDVEIIQRTFELYLTFLADNKTGSFALSTAGQAFALYRERFMPRKIQCNNHADAIGLARAGYYGGRNECYRVGPLPDGEWVIVDVNSMYPYVMHANAYPCQLEGVLADEPLDKLAKRLTEYCAIADVEIRTDTADYPVRLDRATVYPRGRFRTTLCSESLQLALQLGRLVRCYKVAYWTKAPLFTSYVEWAWKLRQQYAQTGRQPFAFLMKLLLNSLYGKFGQLNDVVIEEGVAARGVLTRHYYHREQSGEHGIITECGGKMWRTSGREEGYNSVPEIAAHVTDYGRCYLQFLMDLVGRDAIAYVDTDSLIIPAERLDRLRAVLDTGQLGDLKVVARSPHVALWGCRDYSIGDTRKLTGIRPGAVEVAPSVYVFEQWPGLWGMIARARARSVQVRRVEATLLRVYHKGAVSRDGRVYPWFFPMETSLVGLPPRGNNLRGRYRLWLRRKISNGPAAPPYCPPVV